jgi:hypothetical protein
MATIYSDIGICQGPTGPPPGAVALVALGLPSPTALTRMCAAAPSVALRVLERCGAPAVFPPGQTCCGRPSFNAVVPFGSCAARIRLHHG